MKDRYLALNLRLFDTTINATTSNSSGNNLSAEMKTYYDNYLIDNAEPGTGTRPVRPETSDSEKWR